MQRLLVGVRGPNEALAAAYLGRSLVRTVKEWRPECKVYPAVFPEEEFSNSSDPLTDGPNLVEQIDRDHLHIDTFHKHVGKGLLHYYSTDKIRQFVEELHTIGKEAWIARSISRDEIPSLWETGVDVICARSVACSEYASGDRFSTIQSALVGALLPQD